MASSMLGTTRIQNPSNLPSEIWAKIAEYLSFEELSIFKQLCITCHNIGNALWQPFFNRLKVLDPQLSIPLNTTFASFDWFVGNIERISAIQYAEITYLQKNWRFSATSIPSSLIARLLHILSPTQELNELEERNRLLNEINLIFLNAGRINEEHRLVVNLPLTRFPIEIFEDKDLQIFWSQLEELIICDTYYLTSLPANLGNKCPALVSLECGDNRLTTLPASLGNCKNLTNIYCHSNRLTTLPAELADCPALQTVNCNDNIIRAFPAVLKNKWGLLWCTQALKNQLTYFGSFCRIIQEYFQLQKENYLLWCKQPISWQEWGYKKANRLKKQPAYLWKNGRSYLTAFTNKINFSSYSDVNSQIVRSPSVPSKLSL